MSLSTLIQTITTGKPVTAPFFYSAQRVFSLNCTANQGLYGWFCLPGGYSISFNVNAEDGEVLAGKLGPLEFYRPETDQERRDREDAWAEAAYEEYEATRYW